MKRCVTQYTWQGKLHRSYTFAVVTDLHNGNFADILPQMAGVDAILVVGDMVLRYSDSFDRAAQFIKQAPSIAPTYYSLGNHEWRLHSARQWMEQVRLSGVHLLDNRYVRLGDDLVLGGLSAAPKESIQTGILRRMATQPGVKLLMCHHPEWYPQYVQGQGMDVTLAGHAHGGQWTLFGQGIYAPGQGLLPKYTHGWYDDKHLLVSRGLTNTNPIPRFGNPCELLLLTMTPEG